MYASVSSPPQSPLSSPIFSRKPFGTTTKCPSPAIGSRARIGRDCWTGRHVDDVVLMASRKNRALSADKHRTLHKTLLQRRMWSHVQQASREAQQQTRALRLNLSLGTWNPQPEKSLMEVDSLHEEQVSTTTSPMVCESGHGIIKRATMVLPTVVADDATMDDDCDLVSSDVTENQETNSDSIWGKGNLGWLLSPQTPQQEQQQQHALFLAWSGQNLGIQKENQVPPSYEQHAALKRSSNCTNVEEEARKRSRSNPPFSCRNSLMEQEQQIWYQPGLHAIQA